MCAAATPHVFRAQHHAIARRLGQRRSSGLRSAGAGRPPAPAPAGSALHGGRTARTRAPDHGAGERGLRPPGRLEGRSVAEPGALFRPGRASDAAHSGRCRADADAGQNGAAASSMSRCRTSRTFGIAKSADLVALDDALTTLETLNPRHSRVVELRFFGGSEPQGSRARAERVGRHGPARLEPCPGLAVSRTDSRRCVMDPERYRRAGDLYHASARPRAGASRRRFSNAPAAATSSCAARSNRSSRHTSRRDSSSKRHTKQASSLLQSMLDSAVRTVAGRSWQLRPSAPTPTTRRWLQDSELGRYRGARSSGRWRHGQRLPRARSEPGPRSGDQGAGPRPSAAIRRA